jgi:mannitol-1-phosphate/altronate dehydrogenase
MSENAEFAKRIIKMRVKYVLEKSQGQILDEKKLKNIADKIRQGENNPAITDEIQKLALNGIEKAKPLLKEVIKQLLDEYAQSVKDITDEAILEMVSSEIQKMATE